MSLPKLLGYPLLAGLCVAMGLFLYWHDSGPGIALHLDEEQTTPNGQVMNPSTQSMNRYASDLRRLDRLLKIDLSKDGHRVSFELGGENRGERLFAKAIDAKFLVPLLPYPTGGTLDAFDHANLMLGEYARNGLDLSFQDDNALFGYFNSTQDLFDDDSDDYNYGNGILEPNPRTRPRRFSVTNNCLKPGLWEFAAKDTVGEMYHSWFKMPQDIYFRMIRTASDIRISDADLADALSYSRDLSDVPLRLDRLRKEQQLLLTGQPRIRLSKAVGSYSSQDSRRKVQKGYFQVIRDGEQIEPQAFTDMNPGDEFKVRKFVAPGVYSTDEFETVPYTPYWSNAIIRSVAPLTRYPGGREADDPLGYVEILLYERGEQRGIVMGNIPVSLLVEQDDYRIPAFGIGVLPPSEVIERRYLRLEEGPVPHYAYQVSRDSGGQEKGNEQAWFLLNNHESGLEQIYLRPFHRQDKVFLRITLVSYERIVDLLEMEIEVTGELADRIRLATREYKPPLFRVYMDANVI